MRLPSMRRRTTPPASPREVRVFENQYSPTRFWTKLSQVARRAGYEVLEKALWLHYAALRPETPPWARATAYGALGYFILPLDAIPDWLYGVGLTDDLGVLTLAVATLAQYIDIGVRRRTTHTLDRWFGKPAHRRPLKPVSSP